MIPLLIFKRDKPAFRFNETPILSTPTVWTSLKEENQENADNSGKYLDSTYMSGSISKTEENAMFAVGHIALGYLTGKATSKLIDTKINIPLVFLVSIIPDVDFLLGLEHRGPTHSLILQAVVFIPILLMYKRQAVPVFASLIQHSLGDLISGAGGVQLFWPVSSQSYGTQMCVTNILGIILEWSAFLVFLAVLWTTGDVKSLFQHQRYSLLFTIPVLTLILPALLQFPLAVPTALIIPHLILLAILAWSIAANLRQILKIKR